MKDSLENIAIDQDWRFPIPKHHMIAICALLTISLLTAVFLPTPNEITNKDQLPWSSTGRLPDSHQDLQSIVYAEDLNATENIDTTPLADTELFDKEDEEVADASDNSTSASDENNEWYAQTVQKGDNINNIFHTLNQPYEALKALEKTPTYGDTLADLQPGDKIYFLLNEKNEIQALIKPLNKNYQVHFIRTSQNNYAYTAQKEPLDSHITASNDDIKSTSDIPSILASDKTTATPVDTKIENKQSIESSIADQEAAQKQKAKEKEMAILAEAKAKKAEEERLRVEAEKLKEENKPAIAVRKSLVVVTIKKGENLLVAGQNAGLTSKEMHTIIRMLRGRFVAKQIMPGDELRVLFENSKENAKINAVSMLSKKQGRISAFRNLSDNKYYDEAGYHTSTSTKFRRYPIAGPIRITSGFNPYRRHPITGKIRPHNGTDFGVKIGTPVYAPADGVVTRATYQSAAGYYVVIKHRGAYSTVYMHLSKILVKVGDKVKVNQRIALSGNTGGSTGPHLHYELRINGKPVNAMKVNLPNGGSDIASTTDRKFANQIKKYKLTLGIK
jgi:murein DD-endopeptidase MepM/ murein hydrolase activator NlpD